jgi:outer membrane lipoprotein-sorting protein
VNLRSNSPRGLFLAARAVSLVCVLFPQLGSAAQLSVDQILRKVGATYQDAQNYRIVAEKNVTVASIGEDRSLNGARTYSNYHKFTVTEIVLETSAPAKARMAVKEDRQELLFVDDGQTTWIYSPSRKEYMEQRMAAVRPSDQAGSNQGSESNPVSQYEILLVDRFRNLSMYAATAVIEKEGTIKVGTDKVRCYVLKIESKSGVHELWVDDSRFLILRSIDTTPTPQDGISMQTTVTFDVKEANLNAKLEDTLFTFVPPENTKRVEALKGLSNKAP